MSVVEQVRAAFHLLAINIELDDARYQAAWRYLEVSYMNPLRSYHPLHHLADGLRTAHEADLHNVSGISMPLLSASWFFHDVIYDARSKQNEFESAMVAQAMLSGTSVAPRLEEMILATRHDGIRPATYEAQLLCDIDLASLSTPDQHAFELASHQIREEYSFVPNLAYATVRLNIMGQFLLRAEAGRLYYTPIFNTSMRNGLAIANLLTEIARLNNVIRSAS